MLNLDSKEKLTDYLEGFMALQPPALYPIGAIITNKENLNEVEGVLTSAKIMNLDWNDSDFTKQFLNILEKGKSKNVMVLKISTTPSLELRNLLDDFARGSISLNIPGEDGPRVLNPIPQNNAVLLIMTPESYDNNLLITKFVSSVCRL